MQRNKGERKKVFRASPEEAALGNWEQKYSLLMFVSCVEHTTTLTLVSGPLVVYMTQARVRTLNSKLDPK